MAACQKCHKQWSWKEITKKSFTFEMKMDCPHCGQVQYISAKARKKAINFAMILQLIWLLPLFLGATSYFTIISVCTALIMSITLSPFLLELSNEEEPLW